MEAPPWPRITPGPGMRGCLVQLLPRTDPETSFSDGVWGGRGLGDTPRGHL